jgi:predicted permease
MILPIGWLINLSILLTHCVLLILGFTLWGKLVVGERRKLENSFHEFGELINIMVVIMTNVENINIKSK